MKTTRHIMQSAALLALLSTLNPQFSTGFAQGSLTPPGMPAPTMKSLDQVYARTDARTAITNSGAVTISASGSYYLTTNITVSSGVAIWIAANNVTLDLNGFTLSSTRAIATIDPAIQLSSVANNVCIYNGHISSGVTNTAAGVFGGSGFSYGIFYSGNSPNNVRVKDLSVAGVLHSGIYLSGNSTVVESCTVNIAGDYGIYADSVSDSTAMNCGSYSIYGGTAHNCKGYGIGSGTGLHVTTANNCSGYSSGSGYGLYASSAATGCYGYNSSSGIGLYAYNAAFCAGYRSGGTAIQATIANGCVAQSGTNIITYKYNMP